MLKYLIHVRDSDILVCRISFLSVGLFLCIFCTFDTGLLIPYVAWVDFLWQARGRGAGIGHNFN